MSTTHGQPGLSSEQRSTIRNTILDARQTLEDELRRQLEKYGIYENETLPLDDLTHLSAEEIYIRRSLDATIERELESTKGDLGRSITNYVREATKTYLNRFVALKTIEVRGLVEETITERPEYGNRSYMHHTVAEIAGELTNAPDDGFDAALDLAYQEIGAEIRMIFEDSEHTAIDLDAHVREEVLDELDAIDDRAWESDEALGWVYQYFGEEEREEIDERVDDENYKIAGTDIATKTQLFTPRYIVEWMVDNSLGRTWLEMHGERTSIDDKETCFYLAPLEDSLIDRETKPVEEITVLDPACGSGHMLFYAFDVLYRMYLEEGEIPEEYIPREILRNNLYGIDIDSGAAQIAALSLYLKAKEKSPDVTIPQLNIVSADAVLVDGDRKQDVLDRARSELEAEILEQVWKSFDDIRELGSLVEVDDRIDNILEEYRETFESKGQAQFTEGGSLTTQSTFVSEGQEETWEEFKESLMRNVRELARSALARDDPVEEMFAEEVGKTVEVLDVLIDEYDVVVTNPPYLQSKKMGGTLKRFLRDNYTGKSDVYGAFIERCLSFARDDGHASLVTPENFMFLYYFRGLRKKLLNESYFIEAAHLSRYGFEQQKDAYTIPFVLRPTAPGEDEPSRFYRMTHEQAEYENYEDKISGLESIVESLRQGESHKDVYNFSQNRFKDIGRRPFVYWFGEETLRLFTDYPKLEDVADVRQGLATGDDERFLRKWWEVGDEDLEEQYVLYQKSGSKEPFYDVPDDFLLWENDGEEIRNTDGGNGTPNEQFYFTPGLTYRNFGNYLVARLFTEEMVFSQTAIYVQSENITSEYLLGVLNSILYRFIANGINPGLHFEAGDGKRFPIKTNPDNETEVVEHVESAIQAQKQISQLDELSADFSPETFYSVASEGVNQLLLEEDVNEYTVELMQGVIDDLILDEYGITETVEQMYENLPSNLSNLPQIDRISKVDEEYTAPFIELSDLEFEDKLATLSESDQTELRALSEEVGLSPVSVAQLRYEYDLYDEEELENAAGSVLSFILGNTFGRWHTEIPEASDEIVAFGSSTVGEVEELVKEGIDCLFGESEQARKQLENLLGKAPVDWLRSDFFRSHHCKEYRRRGQRIPIYWQLESPDGAFSCFVYYHEIDANTLPKLRGQYLDPRIDELENERKTLNAQTSGDNPDRELLSRKEEVQNDLDDIEEFRDTIDEMIDDGATVDVDKGIWENIKEWDQYEVLETGLPKLKSSYSR
ncbi:BREX-1 system adenine-specific DNA-methyltransferase PglX [Natronococcus wangiae]|uniref:BREX-1 system adenine-specific DNA-methyltransferase PglX n=1 Tax=Natronococcus wangiae TaxID=3068275 RepID=UPI00273E9B48|nr:BREX-1 system adenine-specific DNA-methyltransferase PglX [Natronococcus sp. AD5]